MTPYCLIINLDDNFFYFYGKNCVEKFLDFIFEKGNNIIYCHNLNFDGGIILNYLNKNISIKKSLYLNGNIYSFTLLSKGYMVMFKCSSKILPLKLKEIGKIIGEEKKEFDYLEVSDNNFENNYIREKTLEYCKQDVIVTKTFMELILNDFYRFCFDFQIRCFSISSLSLNVFFFLHPKFELFLSTKYDSILRYGNLGGRCEVFGNLRKNENLYHFDFSGMYSHRLLEEYPVGKGVYVKNIKKIDKPGVYCINVYSDLFLPILPFKNKKLFFPNGRFKTVVSHHEVNLFLKNGGKIESIDWGFIYEKEEKIFKKFAEFCIENRKKSSKLNIVWKLLANSFIGRLGMKNELTRTILVNMETFDPLNTDIKSLKIIKNIGIAEIFSFKKNKNKNNVLVPLITTSKARVVWWELAKNVIGSGGRLLYCDTDSIYMAHLDDFEEFCGVKWDKLKDGVFISAKNYGYISNDGKEVIKIKGIKHDNKISFEELKKDFLNQNDINVNFKYWSKKDITIKILDIKKKIRLDSYDKRIFNSTKTDTKSIWL